MNEYVILVMQGLVRKMKDLSLHNEDVNFKPKCHSAVSGAASLSWGKCETFSLGLF